jgi:hypothetical protein
MNATNYVLELMIAGIFTFLWIGLLAFSFWGDDIPLEFVEGNTLMFTIVLLPILYVIGIITDRLTDELFERLFPLRKKHFTNVEEHRKALSEVYVKSETLTKLYEYGRMRIRICRNWTVNGLLILVSLIAFIWSGSSGFEATVLKLQVTIFAFIILGGSVLASYYAWKRLNLKDFQFLKLQIKLLIRKKCKCIKNKLYLNM